MNKIPEFIEFNGVTYRLMGGKKYYLSQSSTNAGRKKPKGLHVSVWEFHTGKTVPKGYVIHHKDENTLNNEFSNLECLSRSEHSKHHPLKNPEKQKEHLERVRPLASKWHSSEDGRAWHSSHSKNMVRTPKEYKCQFCGTSYLAKTSNTVCCSNQCFELLRAKRDKENPEKYTEITCICESCKNPFTYIRFVRRAIKRTCSGKCAYAIRTPKQHHSKS